MPHFPSPWRANSCWLGAPLQSSHSRLSAYVPGCFRVRQGARKSELVLTCRGSWVGRIDSAWETRKTKGSHTLRAACSDRVVAHGTWAVRRHVPALCLL